MEINYVVRTICNLFYFNFRKRILSEDRSKSLSPSPTSKRARDSSPAVSVKSRHSVGTIERIKVKEEPEVKSEKSKSRSVELDKDTMSEKSHGSERRPERKQKETSVCIT